MELLADFWFSHFAWSNHKNQAPECACETQNSKQQTSSPWKMIHSYWKARKNWNGNTDDHHIEFYHHSLGIENGTNSQQIFLMYLIAFLAWACNDETSIVESFMKYAQNCNCDNCSCPSGYLLPRCGLLCCAISSYQHESTGSAHSRGSYPCRLLPTPDGGCTLDIQKDSNYMYSVLVDVAIFKSQESI